MEISPLYQILIYLEDKGSATLDEIKSWGIAVSRGVLGKMEAMYLVEKTNGPQTISYKLSRKGYEFLNSILDQIHKETQHWDGKWRLVWFSIPEKQRSKRDKFRRYLESLGLKPILNSLWITPVPIKNKLSSYISKHNLNQMVVFVESATIMGLESQQIIAAWDFDVFRLYYNDFMSKADQILNSPQKNTFELKKLIFEYATILNCEPNLPIELMPRDWPRFRANLYYRKIKRAIS